MHESRQHQASEDRFAFSVVHSVIALLQAYKNEVYLFPRSSMREWQNYSSQRASLDREYPQGSLHSRRVFAGNTTIGVRIPNERTALAPPLSWRPRTPHRSHPECSR